MKRRDIFVPSAIALVMLAAAGLAAVGLAFRSMRDTRIVVTQFSYAVSGVLGGVALVGFALGLLAIQATRRREADERAEFDRVVVAASQLMVAARSRQAK